MTDWIDASNEQHIKEEQRRADHRQIFYALSGRKWEALTRQIRHDADKLNSVASSRIKDKMRVNGRGSTPGDLTLHVDNIAFPAIYLDIHLDRDAESIHIHQLRRESDEGNSAETDERILLVLTKENEMVIRDVNGKPLSIEETSKYILGRFLDR
jgi:hypothetical protein